MEAYVAALNYAIPFFITLIFIEMLAAWKMEARVIRSMDTLSSLSSGLTNVMKDVLGLTLIIVSYGWMVNHIALIEIETTWLLYVLAFVGLDFSGYWVHRIAHMVNYFWNHHIIHHSSEEYNLGCALRQSVSRWFSISFIFLVPTALLGIPAHVLGVVAPLHLFAQYWYHTRLIGKLGFLEKVIVTPSHHRVHHAINDIYLDKNLSQIFIIWDHLFGTFQEELKEVSPVYGVKKAIRSWNPFIINFTHVWQIIKDAWRAKSWMDKLTIWFRPTGWRPVDAARKYPIKVIEDVFGYQKYDPKYSVPFHVWSWIQYLFIFGAMMYMFNNGTNIGFQGMLLFTGFLFLCINSMTMLMDGSRFAWIVEGVKSAIGLSVIVWISDWFLINTVWSQGALLFGSYFLLSAFMSIYFTQTELKSKDEVTLAT
jgi:sterol desaturase/sphingolipid hydroxylase (fatty acid hydroxylase superfamily)